MRITIDTEKKELTFNGPLTIQEFMEFMNFIPTSETYLKVMEYTILPAKEEPTINKWVAPIYTPCPNTTPNLPNWPNKVTC